MKTNYHKIAPYKNIKDICDHIMLALKASAALSLYIIGIDFHRFDFFIFATLILPAIFMQITESCRYTKGNWLMVYLKILVNPVGCYFKWKEFRDLKYRIESALVETFRKITEKEPEKVPVFKKVLSTILHENECVTLKSLSMVSNTVIGMTSNYNNVFKKHLGASWKEAISKKYL